MVHDQNLERLGATERIKDGLYVDVMIRHIFQRLGLRRPHLLLRNLFIMDVDPLADTVPPRHSIESDEEEDEYNPLHTTSSELNQVAEAKILPGDLPQGRALVVATGDIAKYWASGADLGEQSGGVYVNNIQVGLVFNPKWTNATIIISEVLTRLPVWSMHSYAAKVLDALKPSKISLLDTYPTPSYISEKVTSPQDAPLRYLVTSSLNPMIKSKAELFAPPNLIQSTSASFLSILSTSHRSSPGTLILVPFPHIPHPPPKILEPSNFLRLSEDNLYWARETINLAQNLVFVAIDESPPPVWTHSTDSHSTTGSARKKGDVGDGGMYI